MIALWSISKMAGRKQFKNLVLQDVNWIIGPRERIVLLGHPNSGAPALLDIIGGLTVPTSGWVERRATLSVPRGLLRYGGLDTPRQLISRLSRLYQMDAKEVTDFVAAGLGRSDILDLPPRATPGQFKQRLNMILTLAFPFDFYLFHSPPGAGSDRRFEAFCEKAIDLRSRESGIIVRASSSKIARRMNSDMMGALVYQGSLTLYRRLADAIAVFDCLPAEEGHQQDDRELDATPSEGDNFDFV